MKSCPLRRLILYEHDMRTTDKQLCIHQSGIRGSRPGLIKNDDTMHKRVCAHWLESTSIYVHVQSLTDGS